MHPHQVSDHPKRQSHHFVHEEWCITSRGEEGGVIQVCGCGERGLAQESQRHTNFVLKLP